MGDIIGIFKELREGEKVNLDSEAVLPIVLVKEVDTKGLIRKSQKEVPTALMFANLYVTSQRLTVPRLPPDPGGRHSQGGHTSPTVRDDSQVVRDTHGVDSGDRGEEP